ncbi:MAG: glycosyltransferase [Lacipirellulaceae bacterium]
MPINPSPSVLHVTSDLAYGGAATQLALLVEHEARQGRSHALASLRYPGNAARRFRAPVAWLGARWTIDPFAAIRLGRELRRRRPGLVQTWDSGAALLMPLARRGFRWAHVVRGAGRLEPGDLLAIRNADVLLAAEPEHAAMLVAAGAKPGRVRTVPNACRVGAPPTIDRAQVLERWGISDGAPLVVAALRLDDGRFQKELPWAADLVRVVRSGVRLVVVGDGPHRGACERFTREAAEQGTVVYPGSRDDWPDLLAVCDLVWCLSKSPGAPTSLLEALAAGKPVVASSAVGRDRLIRAGYTGWSIDPTDRAGWARATQQVLGDPANATRIAAAGRDAALALHAVERVAGLWLEAVS